MPREGKARVLNQKEFNRLLTILRAGMYPERNLALVYLSFGCALRVKEIAALNIRDVLDEQGALLSKVSLTKRMTKGGKQRDFYLVDQDVKEAISQYVKIRMQMGTPAPHRDAPLFVSQKKQRFSPNTLQKAFKEFYDKAGLTGASSHTGRRTFATNLADKGVDLKSLQVLMGHDHIQTTAGYIEDNPNKLAKIVKEALFK